MAVPLCQTHSRKLNNEMMERNGRNGIFGDRVRKEIIRWCSFSYFIWVTVFRAFSYISVSLQFGYSADVQFSVPLLFLLLLFFPLQFDQFFLFRHVVLHNQVVEIPTANVQLFQPTSAPWTSCCN